MGRQQARISRAENGVGSLSPVELDKLLSYYGVSDAERDDALALGAQARKRQRGRAYTDQLPRSFERLADLQADARMIGSYDTGAVPGLVQSPDYAHQLITACDGVWWASSEREIETRTAFRLEQQRRVLDAPTPKELNLVLTETALDQVVGTDSVMRGQILHLLRLAELYPDLRVQILPASVPNNPILGGGLITLDFGLAAPRIAFSSVTYGPSTYHDREEDTAPMFGAFDRVRELALSPEKSTKRLLARLEGMHR